MVVSVRLFAGLRERAGASHVDVELPDGATVGDLLAAMELAPRSCVAALTVYDMVKGIEPGVVIERIELLDKTGGKSDFHRP